MVSCVVPLPGLDAHRNDPYLSTKEGVCGVEQLIVSEEAWPHGLRCMDCDARMEEGAAYSKRLVAITDHHPVVEIVCVPCGLGLTSGR